MGESVEVFVKRAVHEFEEGVVCEGGGMEDGEGMRFRESWRDGIERHGWGLWRRMEDLTMR